MIAPSPLSISPTSWHRGESFLSKSPTTRAGLLDRARQHAATVAAEHFSAFPIERIDWEISEHAHRAAGATKYDPATGEITISLAWDAYRDQGWEQFSATVRHELIHAWQYHEFGEADHGRTFERWTDALDTSQYCERFTTPTWWVVCTECGGRLPARRGGCRRMTGERCPTCGREVMVTAIDGPMAITIYPCSHEIGHMAALIDAPPLDPLSPGEWLTEFLANSDD